MPPSGGDDRAGEGSERFMRRGVGRSTAAVAAAGQDLGAEPGNRKRKVSVMSRDTGSLVGSGEHLKVACDDSQRILNEIEDLRAQLDEDVKNLGYCEANQKLRVELALKAKEVQCLRKQNEEMHAKYDGMRKSNEELQDKNDDLMKQNEELQDNNNGLVKQNEVLQTSNDGMKIVNVELQAKNDGLTKQIEELQAKNVNLVKQNEDLQANNDSMGKRNGELQAKNGTLIKWNEDLQAKNDTLTKLIEELQDENDALGDLSGCLVRKEREYNDELQQARKELIMVLEVKLNGRTAIGIKRMGELYEKPFQNACKRKYGSDDYLAKAAELASNWQEELKKPSWHPFKVVQDNGEYKEFLDDDDAKLKYLRTEYGDNVCNAVKTALMEINEYNPSGGYVVPEFWNFNEGRKATMKEVLNYLFRKMETTTKRSAGGAE